MVLTQDWLMKHALPRNDLFLAKRVLMDRADLTACDKQGNSVLAVAVEHQCSREMVELLLERGCPRSSKGPLGPPLAIAARSGRLEVVRALLDYGCDPCEIEAGKLPEAAKVLLGYLVPRTEAVLRRSSGRRTGSLTLRRLRRELAVNALLPLASAVLPSLTSLQGGQRNLDAQLVQVLVLGCEHAAPLPSEALESLVRVCRSLLMSFDSSSINLGLRLASCLCEAGKDTMDKLRRYGILKMLPGLAATPELHQPPRPQHIRQAAASILSRWSDEMAQSGPTPCLASAERWQELCHLTPSELISLKVPQRLLRDAEFRNAMPKELAAMSLKKKKRFQFTCTVNGKMLAATTSEGATKDVAHGGQYVQAEPLVTMGSLARLLLVAGGFLGMEDMAISPGREFSKVTEASLRFCVRLVGCKVFQGNSMYHVEGDNGLVPHVLALGEWRFEDLEECSGASNFSIERNEDVQGLVSDYKEAPAEVWKASTVQSEPDDEALYLELLRIEAKANVRPTLASLCEQCCVAVVSAEDNEIVDAIAQSVDGMLVHEAAVTLLKQFGWRQRDMEEQEDASFTLWDPPDVAPVLPAFFHLAIQPPPPDPPGMADSVWSVIISFDAELPFELVWQSVELDVKNAFTSVSNKWSEIGWPGGEQEMLEVVHKAVAAKGEAAVARGLTHSSASRIADRLMAAVACRVVAEPEATGGQGSAGRGKGSAKSALRDLVEIKIQDAWMPAVVVQEAPSLYVSLATGALATGKHRNMPGFEGPLPQLFANRPRLYPVPPVEPQVQTRADLQALERGAESSRITRRFNVDECSSGNDEPPVPILTRGAWLPKPTLAYELGGSSSSTSPTVSLLRGKDVRVEGCSWVSTSWTTVGLPELNSSGKVYYELHIESHDMPQIGWASEKFRFFGDTWLYGVGDDLESWGVD
ncbi:UPL3, partial [Symbiodinium pilosum]